jgi:hypothetical protein
MLRYYKCSDCLATATIDDHDQRTPDTCGICGGYLKFMGEVHQDQYVKFGTRCVCDERCTYAEGPNCECSCGGANHGIKRLGDITVIEATGKVKLTLRDSATVAKYQAQAAEFKAAYEAAQARVKAKLGKLLPAYYKHIWLPREDWDACRLTLKALRDAQDCKVHKLRLSKCTKICA